MNRRFFIQAGLALVVTSTSFAVPSHCEAGPLLDWIFRRRAARQTAYNAQAAGAAGCCGGAAYCEQTVVRYVPQVAYRTVWQPVPVTSYKRTTHCNPQTGLPMTCVKPCTQYTYQARQVPYTSYRPIYTKVPVTMPANNLSMMPIGGCNSCSVGSAGGASAYPSAGSGYSSPGYSTPSYGGAPSYSNSGSSSNGYSNHGSYGSSQSYGGYSGTPSPADPPGATQWERAPGTGSSSSDRGGYSEQDYYDDGNRRPRPPLIQNGSSSRRSLQRIPSTSRMAGTGNGYGDRSYGDRMQPRSDDRFYRGTTRFNSEQSRSERLVNRIPQGREPDSKRSIVKRHTTIDRSQALSRSERLGESHATAADRAANRFDISPIPNIDPPANRDLPRLLNEDREAMFRTIPTRYASRKIRWDRITQASYQGHGIDRSDQARSVSRANYETQSRVERRNSNGRETQGHRTDGSQPKRSYHRDLRQPSVESRDYSRRDSTIRIERFDSKRTKRTPTRPDDSGWEQF